MLFSRLRVEVRRSYRCIFTTQTFDVQSELRSQNFAGVDRALLTNLASLLTQHNTHIQSFMSLYELARDNAPTGRYKIVIHADKRPANEHIRRYNEPSCSEVAALIPGNEDGMIGEARHLAEETRPS